MEQNTKARNKVVNGLVWTFGERVATQIVALLISIILARHLSPEHYGVISIVLVFINLLDVFVTTGFGSALVQKKETDVLDFDTAFLLSFGVSLILYTILFAVAPYIALFYNTPELCAVLRIMGLRLPLAAINNIQQAHVQRRMNFKCLFSANTISTVGSGIVGAIIAACGFGVWALVTQHLTHALVVVLVLFIIGEWRPKLRFSAKKAKDIWSFGWKVLGTQLVATLESDLRSLVVGKEFGPADLAYYDQGRKYPALIVTNISSAIDNVMLPAYSREQDDRSRILAMLRRSIRIGLFVMTPVLLGFAIVAESFVCTLLTEKWLDCVPFMQIFCITYLTRPLESSCRQALLSIGKSDIVFKAMIIIHIATLLGVVIGVFVLRSVFAIALSSLLMTAVSLICFLTLSNKFFGYTLKMQLQDSLPSILVGLAMALVVGLLSLVKMPAVVLLVLQVLVGVTVYVACSALLKLEPFTYLARMLKEILKRN